MLNRIRSLFAGDDDAEPGEDALQAAAAALMVEAARTDNSISEAERERILAVARRHFNLSEDEAQDLLSAAVFDTEGASPYHRYVSVILDRCPPERRIWIIEMLWEVAYADGVLNDLEASLLRRIGGLLHVSDVERGEARKRVLQRLGLPDDAGLPV
ncbi:TerB family tellurite resistance protein [Azospirillum picis]|uniref:Tellurite resistance protein B-like protein n=1 Tax=Azospirillum picis TaxID=488438 RepID=A0ABU0MJ96_9PROT|nr:TerB family tellurite resistance protein [Azospirillum picis]MBP2299422.1 putative tellurite resistance protein B-like protein [Azospirillum picis]MDQ0533451.1 putative tellurite resistance protein B-like protein [Azospirillum picis]